MLIPLEKLLEGRKGGRKRRQRGNIGMTELVKRKRDKKRAKEQRRQAYLQKQKDDQQKKQDKLPSKLQKTPKPEKSKKKDPTQPTTTAKRKRARGGLAKKPPKTTVKPGGLKGPEPSDKVGAQLAHCVLAVKGQRQKTKKGKKPRKKISTRGAWNICRWSLTRHGYLKPPYKINQQLKNLKLTQKGARANTKHAMTEPDAPEKYAKFKKLFREIEADVVAGRGREYKR